MSAASEIGRVLRGVNLGGGAWLVSCPMAGDHEKQRRRSGPTCVVQDLAGAKLSVACSCGCPASEILESFARRGLIDPPPGRNVEIEHEPDSEAVRIWHEAQGITNTHGERYLRNYGVRGDLPPSLRFSPARGPRLPAIVAGVQAPDRRIIAVQILLLDRDRPQIALMDRPRILVGALGAGAVRLTRVKPNIRLEVAVETALLANDRGIPTWAILVADRRRRVFIPQLAGSATVGDSA